MQRAAQQRQRMPPQRERERPVVGDDVLSLGRRRQRGIRFVEGAPRDERRQSFDAGDVPRGVVAMAGERRERIGLGETGEIALVELRAVREIGDARERLRPPRLDDPLRAGLRESGDEAEAETQRGNRGQTTFTAAARVADAITVNVVCPRFLQRALPLAHRHVHRPHLDAVPARIGARAATARRSPSAAS